MYQEHVCVTSVIHQELIGYVSGTRLCFVGYSPGTRCRLCIRNTSVFCRLFTRNLLSVMYQEHVCVLLVIHQELVVGYVPGMRMLSPNDHYS